MIAAARIQRMTRLFDAHIIAARRPSREVGAASGTASWERPKLKGIKERATLYEILADARAGGHGTIGMDLAPRAGEARRRF